MELGLKYEVVENPNLISSHGVVEVGCYLAKQGLPPVPLNFLFAPWITRTGKYRGKLPNRLGGLYKDEYGIKLTPEQRTAIGNIAKVHMVPDERYTFDFTDKFDWEDGDFGDRGSCFWGDNNLAREVMMDEGVIAIRFYDEFDCGNSRAWLYKWSNEIWVLFNAYGSLTSKAIARIFAKHLIQDTDEQWDHCGLNYLTVSGEDGGLVYVNASSQVIFVDGHTPPDRVDLKFPIFHCCSDCGEWIHEGEAHLHGILYLCHSCWLGK